MERVNKTIPKYETKAWMARVVEEEKRHPITNDPTIVRSLVSDHPAYVQHELKHFNVGDHVLVKCTNKKQKRTDAQNRYMHLYFTLIASSSGHTPRQIKLWAKGMHLSQGITEVFGHKVRDVKDTHQLKMLEMAEFLERVEADTGVPLPDAEPFNLAFTQEDWEALKAAERTKYKAFKPKLKGIEKT